MQHSYKIALSIVLVVSPKTTHLLWYMSQARHLTRKVREWNIKQVLYGYITYRLNISMNVSQWTTGQFSPHFLHLSSWLLLMADDGIRLVKSNFEVILCMSLSNKERKTLRQRCKITSSSEIYLDVILCLIKTQAMDHKDFIFLPFIRIIPDIGTDVFKIYFI